MGAVEYMANTVLSVSKEGNGNGSITSSPTGIDCGSECSASFDPNMSVTLIATPGLETVFSGWSGACSGSGDCIVSMDQARSVTAIFTLNQYTVTANAAGNGSGTVASDAGGISYTYPAKSSDVSSLLDHGSAITLTATANTGSTVTWSGCAETGGTSSAATCSFASLDNSKLATATFNLDTYSLAILLEGNGTVTSSPEGIDCGLNCDATYAYNTEVTLTATPAGKSVFKGWSGACSGTDNTCVVTVDQALSVGASFNGNFPWTMFLPAIMNNAKK
jgi:hypothetical protein